MCYLNKPVTSMFSHVKIILRTWILLFWTKELLFIIVLCWLFLQMRKKKLYKQVWWQEENIHYVQYWSKLTSSILSSENSSKLSASTPSAIIHSTLLTKRYLLTTSTLVTIDLLFLLYNQSIFQVDDTRTSLKNYKNKAFKTTFPFSTSSA